MKHGPEGAGASGRMFPTTQRLIGQVCVDGRPAVDVLVTKEGWVRVQQAGNHLRAVDMVPGAIDGLIDLLRQAKAAAPQS